MSTRARKRKLLDGTPPRTHAWTRCRCGKRWRIARYPGLIASRPHKCPACQAAYEEARKLQRKIQRALPPEKRQMKPRTAPDPDTIHALDEMDAPQSGERVIMDWLRAG